MPDYGHDILLGTFITPTSAAPLRPVELAQASERAGLDIVTFQDHPYHPELHDTWTLLSYAAARTERIHLAGNVLNLPLRLPTVLARSAASLDLLAGGRVELGIGAGAGWDAIEAMGVRRLSSGQAVEALGEAVQIIRALWDSPAGPKFTLEGNYYQVRGAQRGPVPAHRINIWVGAYRPRMLRLTGCAADGWLPSWPFLSSTAALADGNKAIDEAAVAAGRSPSAIRRLLNIGGQPAADGTDPVSGPPREWGERLAELALEHGVSAFILSTDDPDTIERFGREVGPHLRELVASGRLRGSSVGSAPAAGSAPAVAIERRSPGIAYGDLPPRLRPRSVTPHDADYDEVRSSYARVGSPGLVIMAESADDVAAGLLFARRQDVPLSIRSGGHGMAGRSTNEGGIIIDVSHLASIEVLDPDTRRVRVGSGATWGHVAIELSSRGWAMTSGNYGDVGVGGLATAGGIGYLLRRYGLTIDHLVAAELVQADGSRVRTDLDSDPELFWAVRGAGANLGIVTALEFDALPVADVIHSVFTFDITDTASFLRRWGELMERAPWELTSFLYLFPQRNGAPALGQAVNIWAGDNRKEAVPMLEQLLGLAPLLDQQAQVLPYSAVVAPLDRRHSGQQSARVRNGFLHRMDDDETDALAALLTIHPVEMVEVRSLGGAMAEVDPDATAFAQRHQLVFASAMAPAPLEAELDAAWATIHPRLDGLYSAYTSDVSAARVPEAFPQPTLERLITVKRRVDPDNVFRGNLDIVAAARELVRS